MTEQEAIKRERMNLKFSLMSAKKVIADYQEELEKLKNKLREVEAERDSLIEKYEPKKDCEE